MNPQDLWDAWERIGQPPVVGGRGLVLSRDDIARRGFTEQECERRAWELFGQVVMWTP